MKDVLKGIKRLFVIEEEIPDQPKKVPVAQPSMPPSEAGTARTAESSRFLDILFAAMQKHNQEGFDYLEFRKSLQSLQDMAMDEPTRYRSAFAVAQTLGISKEKILQSGNFYVGILEEEARKFREAAANQMAIQVEGKSKEMAQATQQAQEKLKQIAELEKQIAALQAQANEIKAQIGLAEKNIQQTQVDFAGAHQMLSGQIHADLERINKYLQ